MATDVAALRVLLEAQNTQFKEGFGEAKSVAERDSKAISRSVQRMTKRTSAGSVKVGKAAKKMGDQFAGAGEGITVATSALQGMGGPSAGPLGTVAGGFASLVNSGLGPASIAIAAVATGGLILSAALTKLNETTAASEAKAKSLMEQYSKLRAELSLAARGAGTGAGDVAVFQAERALQAAEAMAATRERFAGGAGGFFGATGAGVSKLFDSIKGAFGGRDAVQAARAQLGAATRYRDAMAEVAANAKKEADEKERASKAQAALSALIAAERSNAKMLDARRDSARKQTKPVEAATIALRQRLQAQRTGENAQELAMRERISELEQMSVTFKTKTEGVEFEKRLVLLREQLTILEKLNALPPPLTFREGFSEGIESQFISIGEVGASVAASVGSGFGTLFDQLREGTLSAGEAFRNFAESVLVDLARILAVQSLLRIVGFAAAPATAGGSVLAAEGAAAVAGKSASVGFGGAKLAVNITNTSGAKVSAAPGPSGGIEVLVEEAVESSLNRGGKIDRAIQRTYGVTRRGRRA